ncbi:uncharacterized protein EV154DRAFT_560081 [Mucor mucedo]|uniref:uncharacterized protein n=1 Tax=Mucor mucedo TaxID=29922 RepID=UPI00221F5E99|nr:uncharacterized protein EV154DRAFT_560081 [Mucor mucedo]KAI7894710.1 hypothetical protein EV154DRAFT_560081 [Mucor mucedo]
MTSEHKYPCVVGISFDDDSTIAIAHVLEPFNIIELLSIKKEEEKSFSKLWLMKKRREMLCDASESEKDLMDAISEVFDYGVTFSDFKEYLFNIQTTDEEFDKFKEGLTLKKLLTDYLSLIVHIATEKLEVSDEIKKSRYSNDFNKANIRYCFVCPQSLRDFVTECLVEAEIIQEPEVHERISFVTEVEAVAYSLISLFGSLTELTPNQSYLICNVSELAFGIAEINVDTTESLSTVELLYESSDYGSTVLQQNFRDYLKANCVELNLNYSIIDDLVISFNDQFGGNVWNQSSIRNFIFPDLPDHHGPSRENPKTNAFINFLDANENPITITFGDLNRFIYVPFFKHLTQRIIDSFKSLENRKLILSGKYGYDSHIMDYLVYNNDKTFLERAGILHGGYIRESFGAVSATMRLKEFQLPFLIDDAVDEHESDNAYETENTNQNFDFILVGRMLGALTLISGMPHYMQYLTDNDDGYHDFDLDGSTMSKAMLRHASMEKTVLLNDNTTLRIRNEDMKTDIVDPVVNDVLDIIKKQCALTEDIGMKIEGIIMVGGFSQSKYLQKQIKKEFRGVYKVILPDEPINAFSRGAVEYALNPFDILKKYRGPSICLEVQRPLRKYEMVQPGCLKLKGPDGRYYLKSYQQYFVKDGDKIKRKNPLDCFSQLILVEYPKSAVIAIHIKDGSQIQYKLTEIRLNILPETSGIQKGDLVEYKITVKVFSKEVAVQVSYGNHNTLFDYGTFSFYNDINGYNSHTFLNVIIDDYLVDFCGLSPYAIDQLSIGLHDVPPPPETSCHP